MSKAAYYQRGETLDYTNTGTSVIENWCSCYANPAENSWNCRRSWSFCNAKDLCKCDYHGNTSIF